MNQVAEIEQCLRSDGLYGAVRALNGDVPHRYTGIFKKDGTNLRNVALFDKQNASAALWAPFPLGDSFCSLILGTGIPLMIGEARTDLRQEVREHKAANIVQAYCGVPLIDPEGNVLGTLCHFDELAMDAEVDLADMLQMPAVLGPYLRDA